MKKPVYIGAFLDVESQWRLFAACPPKHENVYGDHVTLAFQPKGEDLAGWLTWVGDEVELEILGQVYDERCQAARVSIEGVQSRNLFPHVTISTASGTKPVYSNELIEKHKESWSEQPSFRLRAVIDTYPRTLRI